MSFMTEAFKPVNHKIQAKFRDPIKGIKDAQWTNPPKFAELNKKELSPAQITGIRYERKVEQELAVLREGLGFILTSHKWLIYGNGLFAQPDFIFSSLSKAAILFEVKYTYTDTSNQRKLYTQLLKNLGFNPIISCTVCRNLTSETPRDKIVHDFHDLKQDSIWQLRI